jgi:hypothetical protein
MAQQIIDVGANANDGTGEPLRQAFTAVNDNFTEIYNAGPVGSQVKITGNVVTTTVTNLGLTLAGNGIGNIQANSTIVPGTAGVYDLGAPDKTFQYIYGDYFVGNGALLTGIVANSSYSNSNVAAFLPTYTGNLVSLTGPVVTTANIVGGNITTGGVVSAAGNVAGNTVTGNNLRSLGIVSAAGNITTTANVSANYFVGNGALLTGITAVNIAAAALTGTTLSSNVLYSSLKVVDDLLYLSVVGNVTTDGRFIGSGAGLSNIPAANVSGQVANALVARTVYANAQPNITSVGTLTSLTATGNITGNYFIGNGALLTGIAATNISAAALTGTTLSSNVLYSSLKVVDDLLYLSVVGNVTTDGRFIGSGAGLTNIPAANITGTVANAAYATVAGTAYSVAGANVTGPVANATFAVTAASATTANTATTATTANTANSVAGANVSGTVANATFAATADIATTATTATTAGTVTSAAQPNITSVGTLTSVSVSGNATAGNISTSGRISAVGNITGNYFVGNGSLLTGVLATNINANNLVGNTLSSNVLYSSLKVVDDLLYLDVIGNITTTGEFQGSGAGLTAVPGGNITGTVANAAYATVAGTVASSAQPNITSVGTLTSLSSSGNITANYFIGNGSQITGVTAARVSANALTGNTLSANVLNSTLVSVGNLNGLSVIGNTSGGNFLAQGQVSAVGNITANYFIGNGSQLTGILASNIGVLPTLSVTGNINTGNLLANGLISSVGNIQTVGNITGNYFVGNGSLLTGITVAAGTAIVNGNSNVNVGGNGNVTVSVAGVSNVAVFTPTGVDVTGLISASGNITGNYILGNGSFLTGIAASSVNANALVGNTLSSNVLFSSLTQVGNLANLIVTGNVTGGNVSTGGLVSATGNVFGNAILSNNYLYANGVPIPTGIVYTASPAPPAGPDIADQWYDTTNDVLYEYISDGTSQYWVDVNSPAFAGGVVANVAISGSLIPNANLVYNIGGPSTVFNTAYINTVNVSAALNSSLINVGILANTAGIVLQTNGSNAISIDSGQNLTFANRLRANAMPVGAVVQTVMSSALGGSVTNSTSYVDISSATVSITPSSANSKVLILATGTSSFTSVSGANITADTQLVRSPTTSLQIQNYGSNISGGGIGGSGAIAYSYQDSPGTTSSVTYKLQQKISNASSTLTSTNIWLIAMEIAA